MITAIVHTYNASAHLRRVLSALKGVDELLVVDMESTDDTCAIAAEMGARVLTFPRGEHRIVEPARQWGIDRASDEWVLEVDADEVVTPELLDYLRVVVKRPDAPDGLYIARRNFFMGKEMHSGYPDPVLRFFRRGKVNWPPVIHCSPIVDGRVERIDPRRKELALIHLANESVHSRAEKHLRYSGYEADRKQLRRKRPLFDLLWRPGFIFLRKFIFKGGWRDGARGFILSVQGACNEALIGCKLSERRMAGEAPDPLLDDNLNSPEP